MSTTTQILFNSPALHSLKRDQLVKLCKIHAVKASGKNVDLIDRLKKHAATLPRDTPLSVATRSEELDDNDGGHSEGQSDIVPSRSNVAHLPKPSEQWDVVMESIQEIEESSSQSTLSSVRTLSTGNSHTTGEFGSGSSKTSSVSSSLKAFATSLGLKRNINSSSQSKSTASAAEMPPDVQSRTNPARPTDELTQKAIPYSSIPETDPSALPKTDHFTFSDPEPIPGHALRPGIPAPSNARLSIGTTAAPGTTTTIRLVSASYVPRTDHPSTPNLKPFVTSFDLVLGSPSATTPMHVWPREDRTAGIYPPLPAPFPVSDKKQSGGGVDIPGAMSFPSRPATPEPNASLNPPQTLSQGLSKPSAPFIFGSPEHRLSNQQFRTAAAGVLDEMNKRLADQGVEPHSLVVFNQAGLRNENNASNTRDASGDEQMTDEHDSGKIESIVTEYAARRDALDGLGHGGKKRKSSVALKNKGRSSTSKAAATRVISGGRRKMAIPGGFGDEYEEEDDENEENRRLSKKPRFGDEAEQLGAQQTKAKRVSIAAPASEEDEIAQEEEKKRLREKEAIRRKLEKNKAMRRSSMGRTSIGGVKAPLVPKKKGITSRFGFLSSAKSIVRSVWNRGVTSTMSDKPTFSVPAASGIPQTTKRITKPPIAMDPPAPKPAAPVSTFTSSIGSKGPSLMGRVASGRLLKPTAAAAGSVTSTSTSTSFSRSRSPIPSSFTRPPSIAGSTRSSVAGATSKASSVAGTAGSRTGLGMGLRSTIGSRSGSIAGASSVGTRSSIATGSRVSSLGTRGSFATATSSGIADAENTGVTKREAGKTAPGVKRSSSFSSSRLLAPTASSLARAPSQGGAQSNGPASRRSETARGQNKEKTKEMTSSLDVAGGSARVAALAPITNRPLNASNQSPQSPPERKGKVFSKPPISPSVIPIAATATASLCGPDNTIGAITKPSTDRPVGLKPKQPSGRKPRISRSRVIARLASQRAASGSGLGGARAVSGELVTGRTRSSLGTTAAKRRSFAIAKSARGSDIMMSAKKRARQSEYARRKSRNVSSGVQGVGMDISN